MVHRLCTVGSGSYRVQHQCITELGRSAFKVTDFTSIRQLHRHLFSGACSPRTWAVIDFTARCDRHTLLAFCIMRGKCVTSVHGRGAVNQMSASVDNMICSFDFVRKPIKLTLKRLLDSSSHMAHTWLQEWKYWHVAPVTMTHATHSGLMQLTVDSGNGLKHFRSTVQAIWCVC